MRRSADYSRTLQFCAKGPNGGVGPKGSVGPKDRLSINGVQGCLCGSVTWNLIDFEHIVLVLQILCLV